MEAKEIELRNDRFRGNYENNYQKCVTKSKMYAPHIEIFISNNAIDKSTNLVMVNYYSKYMAFMGLEEYHIPNSSESCFSELCKLLIKYKDDSPDIVDNTSESYMKRMQEKELKGE